MNDIKPIWQRPSKVEEDEYKAFYKSFSKESDDPMAYIHFTAEGEVTFKSILFVPTSAPRGLFDEYGSKKSDYIKLYVRRVFITDDFHDMMPKYLNFVKGVVSIWRLLGEEGSRVGVLKWVFFWSVGWFCFSLTFVLLVELLLSAGGLG